MLTNSRSLTSSSPKSLKLAQGFLLILASLYLFVVMLALVRAGAAVFAPTLTTFHTAGVFKGVGAGWLLAMLSLNGSAVAATAVVLLNTNIIDVGTTFGLIHGSRLGAGLIVLLVGGIYQLRGTDRGKALSTGLQTLLIVQTIHFPAVLLGELWMGWFGVPQLHWAGQQELNTLIDLAINPAVALSKMLLPNWLWFVAGFAGLIISFVLFDKGVQLLMNHGRFNRWSAYTHWLNKPLVLFGLGLFITTFTLSVAISLTLLVPLVARDLIDSRKTIPYMMGAGISTFIDTLVAAFLLPNPFAPGVVWLVMVTVTAVSLFILLVDYTRYEQIVFNSTQYLLDKRPALITYLASLVLLPTLFLLVGGWLA